jgi:hypothetical protein
MLRIREFAALASQERDAITEALQADLSDDQLQAQLTVLRSRGGDGWLPAGKTTRLLGEFRPRYGPGRFEQAYREANAEAIQTSASVLLLPRLEAVFQSHEQLLHDAQTAYESSLAEPASFEEHCRSLSSLVGLVRGDVTEDAINSGKEPERDPRRPGNIAER